MRNVSGRAEHGKQVPETIPRPNAQCSNSVALAGVTGSLSPSQKFDGCRGRTYFPFMHLLPNGES